MRGRQARWWASVAVAVLSCGRAAWAHKPIFSDGSARDAAHAMPLRNLDVSQVVYHEVPAQANQLWLSFDAQKGQELLLQLGVPVIERLKTLKPSVAVLGPGLPEIKLPFDIPNGLGGVVLHSEGAEAVRFHEPFTGTDSWMLGKHKVTLPAAGRYFIVAYVPPNTAGKFWVVFGYKEVFGVGDWLKLPAWIARVRRFHEIGGVPGWVKVMAVGGVAVTALAWAL